MGTDFVVANEYRCVNFFLFRSLHSLSGFLSVFTHGIVGHSWLQSK